MDGAPAPSRSPDHRVASVPEEDLLARVIGGPEARPCARRVAAVAFLHELPLLHGDALVDRAGLTEAQALRVLAALELGRRATVGIPWWKDNVNCPRSAARVLWPYLAQVPHEELWVLSLSSMGKALGVERLAQGGPMSASIDVGTVLRAVLAHPLASALVLAHNHPTSMHFASPSDVDFTQKVVEAAPLVNLMVWDHIVLTHAEEWWSMAENGQIPGAYWTPPSKPKGAPRKRAKKVAG